MDNLLEYGPVEGADHSGSICFSQASGNKRTVGWSSRREHALWSEPELELRASSILMAW